MSTPKGISGWPSDAVGVSSSSELLDSAVWSNVFNAVTKRSFVEHRLTTTGLLFRLHQNYFIQSVYFDEKIPNGGGWKQTLEMKKEP